MMVLSDSFTEFKYMDKKKVGFYLIKRIFCTKGYLLLKSLVIRVHEA